MSFSAASPASAVGPYVDAARSSAFIRASQKPAAAGLINHSEAEGHGASYFWLAGEIPVGNKSFIRLEIPYIDLAKNDEIRDGFGDIHLSAKLRAWAQKGTAVFLLGGINFGSGTADLFPYSTQSTDFEAGAAVVDTLGARNDHGGPVPLNSLMVWASATAVYATRIPDRIKLVDLHGNYATLLGGIVYPLSRLFDIEAGGLGLFFRSGVTREVYYTQLLYHHSPATSLFMTLQGERAARAERAADYSAIIGMSVGF